MRTVMPKRTQQQVLCITKGFLNNWAMGDIFMGTTCRARERRICHRCQARRYSLLHLSSATVPRNCLVTAQPVACCRWCVSFCDTVQVFPITSCCGGNGIPRLCPDPKPDLERGSLWMSVKGRSHWIGVHLIP